MSAVSFGGINAHLLLEEYTPATTNEPAHSAPATPPTEAADDDIVVVSLGARLGSWQHSEALRSYLFTDEQAPATSSDSLAATIADVLGSAFPRRGPAPWLPLTVKPSTSPLIRYHRQKSRRCCPSNRRCSRPVLGA